MICLGIETSCDETAVALVDAGGRILANCVASQIALHRRFGGVVPELASRRHLETLLPLLEQALAEADLAPDAIDLVAVTRGPGLIGSLMVGLVAAKALAFAFDKPLVGVHHLAGHIHAARLADAGWRLGGRLTDPGVKPAVGLIVSGGHTELVHIAGDGAIELLGATRDDAAGEAFDKVARLLGLPYPGGPQIDRLSAEGDPERFAFPRGLGGQETLDFSFSGLKTAVALTVETCRKEAEELPIADLAASFQAAVVDVLVEKTLRAAQQAAVDTIVLAGGVAANRGLRQALTQAAAEAGLTLIVPPLDLCTDNAAMIAAGGLYAFARGRRDDLLLEAAPRLPLTQL